MYKGWCHQLRHNEKSRLLKFNINWTITLFTDFGFWWDFASSFKRLSCTTLICIFGLLIFPRKVIQEKSFLKCIFLSILHREMSMGPIWHFGCGTLGQYDICLIRINFWKPSPKWDGNFCGQLICSIQPCHHLSIFFSLPCFFLAQKKKNKKNVLIIFSRFLLLLHLVISYI